MKGEGFCGRRAGHQVFVCYIYIYESALDNAYTERRLDQTFCGLSERNVTRRYEPKELTKIRDASARVVEAGVRVGSSRLSEQGIFSEISGDKPRSVFPALGTEKIRDLVSSTETVCTPTASGNSEAELLLGCPCSSSP